MSPLFGLMKMMELGLDKAGIRDSMATRQAQAAGGQAMQMANQPLMSPVGGGPFSQPAPQMSPVIPEPQAATPDTFDKIMNFAGQMNNPYGPKSPFQMILEQTGVVDKQPQINPQQLQGLMAALQRGGI
jgi:hypothetical protein